MVVCIPTYEHPEVVQEVLENCAETYHRYGLDVYYYDSSRDTRTRDVIEAYQKKGYDNLFYFHMAPEPELLVIDKLEKIIMMDGISKSYDYMWFLRDRCWCEEKTIKLIYQATEKMHDLIFLEQFYLAYFGLEIGFDRLYLSLQLSPDSLYLSPDRLYLSLKLSPDRLYFSLQLGSDRLYFGLQLGSDVLYFAFQGLYFIFYRLYFCFQFYVQQLRNCQQIIIR